MDCVEYTERITHVRKLLTITALIVCFLSAFLTIDVASAHTRQPSTCSYWSTDAEWTGSNHGYYWDIALLSVRECGTGRYLGQLKDSVCVTFPSQVPIFLGFNHYWYIDYLPVGHQYQAFTPPYPNTKHCLYSGPFNAPHGHNEEACGWLIYADGSFASDPPCVYDWT